MSKVLVLVPHGDDEVLGFGGTITKHVQKGDTVNVVLLRGGNSTRYITQNIDAHNAKKILGYNNLTQLHLEEADIYNKPYELKNIIEQVLIKEMPNTLYTTFIADNHQDHKCLFNAVSIAARPWGPCPSINSIFVGEVFSSSDQSFSFIKNTFVPNFYNALSKEHIDKKVAALNSYTLEHQEHPHPRSETIIRSQASIRGSECREKYAEAFMLLRHFES